jgi:hypothetical protein
MKRMRTPRCETCDGTGWVCEDHPDRPWGELSRRADACDCGDATACSCNVGTTGDAELLRAGYCIWYAEPRDFG